MSLKSRYTAPAVLGVAALIGYAAISGGPVPPVSAQNEPKAVAPVGEGDSPLRKRGQEFVAAFDKGDAATVAGFWSPDADYIGQDGSHVKGRKDIQKMYEKMFAARKGAKLTVTVTASRMPTDGVVMEDGFNEVTPANGDPGTAARFSALLVRKDGQWYLESVRESAIQPPTNAGHFEGLGWLIGDWVGEGEKGESMTASYSWAENQNFIVSNYTVTVNGTPVSGGTQWIAWDPVANRVRSWTFYSNGGYGEGAWASEEGKVVVKTLGLTPTGKQVTVTNVITRVDADRVTWQAVGLTVDGKEQPAPPVMKIKRVKGDRP